MLCCAVLCCAVLCCAVLCCAIIHCCDALAEKINEEKGWEVKIHVDGASGAFVAPFLYPDLEWDFRLKNVVSINASGHKCVPRSLKSA